MEYEQILREQRDDVVVLTLNRPDRLNAWTPQMTAELTDAIEAADADRTVGSVVLTGAGPGFCAGADIERGVRRATARRRECGRAARAAGDWVDLIRSTKPIVAAVNGAAIGMGLTMILPFDRIVVADGAKLSIRFVKLGLVPELASTCSCRCAAAGVPPPISCCRAARSSPTEACALGLVDEVVPPDVVARHRAGTRAFVRCEPVTAVALDQAVAHAGRERDRSAAPCSRVRSGISCRRMRRRSTRKRSRRISNTATRTFVDTPRPVARSLTGSRRRHGRIRRLPTRQH